MTKKSADQKRAVDTVLCCCCRVVRRRLVVKGNRRPIDRPPERDQTQTYIHPTQYIHAHVPRYNEDTPCLFLLLFARARVRVQNTYVSSFRTVGSNAAVCVFFFCLCFAYSFVASSGRDFMMSVCRVLLLWR